MRALISVHDKTGLAEFARGLEELGFEIVASGGTSAFLDEHGVQRDARRGRDERARAARRPREDAAPAHPRRHPRETRPRRRPRGARRAGDRAVRPRLRQLLSVQLDRRETRSAHGGRRRGDRHRRAVDAARRGEELRACRPRLRPGAVRASPRGAHRARSALAGNPPCPRRRRLRLQRGVRGGDRTLVRRGRRPAQDTVAVVREGTGPRLRREPAPAGGLLPRARRAPPAALARRAAARPVAVLQQPARPVRRADAAARVHAAYVRDRQARERVRRRRRSDDRGGVRARARRRSALCVRHGRRVEPAGQRRARNTHLPSSSSTSSSPPTTSRERSTPGSRSRRCGFSPTASDARSPSRSSTSSVCPAGCSSSTATGTSTSATR